MSRRCRLSVPWCVALLAVAAPAGACPVCSSETGQQVREGLFDDPDLPRNIAATLLPFAAFAGVTLTIHNGLPDVRRFTRRK